MLDFLKSQLFFWFCCDLLFHVVVEGKGEEEIGWQCFDVVLASHPIGIEAAALCWGGLLGHTFAFLFLFHHILLLAGTHLFYISIASPAVVQATKSSRGRRSMSPVRVREQSVGRVANKYSYFHTFLPLRLPLFIYLFPFLF